MANHKYLPYRERPRPILHSALIRGGHAIRVWRGKPKPGVMKPRKLPIELTFYGRPEDFDLSKVTSLKVTKRDESVEELLPGDPPTAICRSGGFEIPIVIAELGGVFRTDRAVRMVAASLHQAWQIALHAKRSNPNG
ncbi:MAG: hypothetical protein H6905_01815 [Hyphomicrobiales bacterium]|nr:hypothetical protein [Hyphomicrobiales bacterium]